MNTKNFTPINPDQYSGSKKQKTRALISLAVVGALLLTAAVVAYFVITGNPERVIEKMIYQVWDKRTFAYSLALEGNYKPKNESTGESSSLASQIKGIINAKDMRDTKSSSVVKFIKVKIFNFFELAFYPDFETRIFKDKIYGRLQNPPQNPFIDLSSVKGEWVELANYSEDVNLPKKSSPTKDEIKKIAKRFRELKIISIKKTLPSEIINKLKTRHYIFELNPEKLIDWMVETDKIVNETPLPEKSLRTIRDFFKDLNIQEAQIWVSKKDNTPKKLYLKFKIDEKNYSTPGEFNLDFKLEFISFEETNVEIPKNAKPLEEIDRKVGTYYLQPQPTLQPKKDKKISQCEEIKKKLGKGKTTQDYFRCLLQPAEL